MSTRSYHQIIYKLTVQQTQPFWHHLLDKTHRHNVQFFVWLVRPLPDNYTVHSSSKEMQLFEMIHSWGPCFRVSDPGLVAKSSIRNMTRVTDPDPGASKNIFKMLRNI